jgi:FkbM family methyltransferase
VLHLGAHLAEERADYDAAGAGEVVWVEANPEVHRELAARLDDPRHRAIQAVITDVDGDEVDFFVTNNRRSSSVLPMKLHRHEHPEILVTESTRLTTTTVDTLCRDHAIAQPDLVVLDLQGAELLALRGATRAIGGATAVYAEVSTAEIYEGCAQLAEIDDCLRNFMRVETVMTPHSWGEALYVARRHLKSDVVARDWFSPVKGSVHLVAHEPMLSEVPGEPR